MNNVQIFSPMSHLYLGGNMVFWNDDDGFIQTSSRDYFGTGGYIAKYAAKHGDDLAEKCDEALSRYRALQQQAYKSLLAETRSKCPYRPGDTAMLKEPYSKSRSILVDKVIGCISGRDISYALIGRPLKMDGTPGIKTVIALASDLELFGN